MDTTTTRPLFLLREYTRNNKPVILKNDSGEIVTNVAEATCVSFDEQTFPRNVQTDFRKSATTAADEKKDNAQSPSFYALDTLIFLVQNQHLDNSAYFKECRTHNIEHVSIVDRKKILDYLTGKVDTLPNIQQEQHDEVMTEAGAGGGNEKQIGKRPREATDAAAAEQEEEKPTAKKVKVKSDDAVKRVYARERPLKTRASSMKGERSFEKYIAMALELPINETTCSGQYRRLEEAKKKAASSSKLSTKDRIPLIIVPAAPTSKVTLLNVKELLQDANFVDSNELRKQNRKKPDRVTIERKKDNGQTVIYHVVDNINHFKQSDWDRVCCVFAHGQTWQFKGWKYEKPVDLFSKVVGYYAKWADEEMKSPVKDWNVKPFDIHRFKRHRDKAIISQFWDELDRFNARHKAFLNY